MVGAALAGMGIPIIRKFRNGQGRMRAERLLSLYVILILAGLFALFLLGLFMGKFAPQTFEVWRGDLNSGEKNSVASILLKFVAAAPIAFAASGITFGALAGPRAFLFALFSVPAAAALAAIVVIGAIYVGCAGWSSCP